MRTLLATLMALMVLSFAGIDESEARRLGGGKSFGKSFTTSPFKRQQASPTGAQTAAAATGRRGIFGGMLGGLLVGGLFAWMLGGAFEGLQMMDIIILAAIAYLLFRLFRSMSHAKSMVEGGRTAYAGTSPFGKTPPPEPGSIAVSGGDVPFNLPTDFDLSAFLEGARAHYRTLQEAWNSSDLETLREYFSPVLFEQLRAERDSLGGDQHTEVMFVDAELGRADYDTTQAQISLIFSGRYRDTGEGVEEDIHDIWHLERDLTQPNAPWLIVGIES